MFKYPGTISRVLNRGVRREPIFQAEAHPTRPELVSKKERPLHYIPFVGIVLTDAFQMEETKGAMEEKQKGAREIHLAPEKNQVGRTARYLSRQVMRALFKS